MAFAELLTTSRAAANSTVERLQASGIDARVLEPKALISKAGDGVHVVVPEGDLARARAQLALWEREASGRLERLGGEVRSGLLTAVLSAFGCALALWALGLHAGVVACASILGGFASLFAWAFWQRRKLRRAGTALRGH